MRTISANDAALLAAGALSAAVRLSVKDSGGTYRDLSSYPGFDMQLELSWGEDLDNPGVTWSATLKREQEHISLAPHMQASPLNRQFNPATAYAALLQVGRMMKVEYSLQAEDDPRARTWVHAFTGYVDACDSGKTDVVTLEGMGLEARIKNTYIRRERIYAFAQGADADRGCFIWPEANKGLSYRTFAVGDRMVPTDSKRNGHFYKASAITTGVVAATEPVWPTGGGATVVDGGVTWTECGTTSTSVGTPVETVIQQILDDNLGAGAVTLWCPTSPSWQLIGFKVGTQSTWDELKVLADQIGWLIRYMDDSGTPKLKLFDPLRSTTTSLRTFSKSEGEVTTLATRWNDIRNTVRGVYSDVQDLDASGNPKRKVVEVTDSASVTKYGDLFCAVEEDSNSNIDTSTEMTAMLNAMLSDLAEPTASFGFKLLRFFPFVEIADLYTLAANQVHFDTDQKLAVSSYRHQVGETGFNTVFALRGKPASNNAAGWFSRMDDAEGALKHGLTTVENFVPIALIADTLPVGGVRIQFDWGTTKIPEDTEFELHLSKSSGFTPDSSTRAAVGKERHFEVGNLDPNATYYAQLVPLTWNARRLIRGSPSAELSFVPGYLKAAQVSPEITPGPAPANGGFESWFNGSGNPPDHWTVQVGAWGREVNRSTGRSGSYSLNFTSDTTTVVKVRSAFVPAAEKIAHTISAWVQPYGSIVAGDELQIAVEWYDASKSLLATDGFVTDLDDLNGDEWTKLSRTFTPPDDTKFARVYLAKTGSDDYTARIDDIELKAPSDRWHTVGDGGEPPYEDTWVGFGADEARFRLDGNHAEMAGVVTGGTIGNNITTLPEALWPAAQHTFPVASNDAYGQVTIATDGRVIPDVGSSTWLSLAGIRWPLD